ncbi:MAG: hypothetical protein IJN03_00085 [Bacilli bacterium]|nr:hypothetical protein [Bacilli bacterium]
MDINEILNKAYMELKPLIISIKEHNTCEHCTGTFLNVSCKYCGSIDPVLDHLVTKLNAELIKLDNELSPYKNSKMPLNKLFNLFMLLYDREIPMLDIMLDNYKYRDVYYSFYNDSLEKMNNGQEFSELEMDTIESMINSNNGNVELLNYYNYFIRNTFLRSQNVSYETFRVIIKQYMELMIKKVYPNGKCIIDNKLKEEIGGNAFHGIVSINEIDIKYFYEGLSFFLLFTMTHELQHTYQYKEIYCDEHYITPFLMDQIKEFAIFDHNVEYYLQNHDNISFEKEAEMIGIGDAVQFINFLEIELPSLEYFIKRKAEFEEKLYDRKRILNGEDTTLDDEFAKVIAKHPGVLKKYNKLNLLYKVVEGKAEAKTIDELVNDFNNMMENPELNDEQRKLYMEFYRHYIGVSRRN